MVDEYVVGVAIYPDLDVLHIRPMLRALPPVPPMFHNQKGGRRCWSAVQQNCDDQLQAQVLVPDGHRHFRWLHGVRTGSSDVARMQR
jgi:hypothetical protein